MKRLHVTIAALLIAFVVINVWVIRTYLLYHETTVEMVIKKVVVYNDTTFVLIDEDGDSHLATKSKPLECAIKSVNEYIPVHIRTFLDDRTEYVVDVETLKECIK